MSSANTLNLLPEHQLLLDQLEQQSEETGNAQEYLMAILPELMTGFSAQAGVIWLADAQANLHPAFQQSWLELEIHNDENRAQLHRQLISQAASSGQVMIAGPQNKSVEELPLSRTFAIVPLLRERKLFGLIELVLPAEISEEQKRGILIVLETVAGYVDTLESQHQDSFIPLSAPGFWEQAEPFFLLLYQQLNSRRLAYEAVNYLRPGLGVDRVTIMSGVGNKPKVLAVSGQAKVSGYSPLIKQLKLLTGHVLQSEEELIHTGKEPLQQTKWSKILSEYLGQSGTQMLSITPLWSQSQNDHPKQEPNRKPGQSRKIVGALVVERSRTSRFDEDRQEALHLYADHLGNAMHSASRYESVFLLPIFRAVGESLRWLHRHKFWQSLVVLCCLLVLMVSLIVVPWQYRVTGEGVLMPVVQRQVFSPWEAEVEDVFVSGGETVTAGTRLVQLKSKQMEAEEIRLRTLIEEKKTSLRSLRSARQVSLKSGKTDEALEIEGRFAELQVELKNLELQHEVIQERIESLLITAPINGVVATFQVRELLQHRPLNRGDLLMEVMDPTGPWHLELDVEDRRMGHLLRARQKSPSLAVDFILATDPETGFSGTVKKVGTRTNTQAEKGNLVDVQVAIGENGKQNSKSSPLPPLRIGAEVKAKIDCGPKPLGYVLFGDVIDYLRKKIWL